MRLAEARLSASTMISDSIIHLFTGDDIGSVAVPAANLFAEQAKAAGVEVKVTKKTPFYDDDYLSYPFAQDFWNTRNYIAQAVVDGLRGQLRSYRSEGGRELLDLADGQIVDAVMHATGMRRLKFGMPIPLISALTAVTDRVLPIFPFEEQLYQREQIDVRFVGHPLIDLAIAKYDRESYLRKLNLDPSKPVL